MIRRSLLGAMGLAAALSLGALGLASCSPKPAATEAPK